MNCPSAPHTHSLAEVCELIGCESGDWLIDRVRDGTFPARRVVRTLRFSDSDISRIIDACSIDKTPVIGRIPMPTVRSRRDSA